MLIGQRKEETNVDNESMGYMITANFLMLHEQTKLLPDFQEALEHYYFTNINRLCQHSEGQRKC